MTDEATNKPPTPDFSQYQVLVDMGFEAAVVERQELKAMIADMEAKVDALNKDIEAAMVVADVKTVLWNGIPVRRQNGKSASKIDAKLLASAGVSADVITGATIPGTSYTYVIVADPAAKKTKKDIAMEATSGDAS